MPRLREFLKWTVVPMVVPPLVLVFIYQTGYCSRQAEERYSLHANQTGIALKRCQTHHAAQAQQIAELKREVGRVTLEACWHKRYEELCGLATKVLERCHKRSVKELCRARCALSDMELSSGGGGYGWHKDSMGTVSLSWVRCGAHDPDGEPLVFCAGGRRGCPHGTYPHPPRKHKGGT